MQLETVDGILIRAAGTSGRALWFVHGFGESGQSFVPLFDTPLAAQALLLVPDLPGFGCSPPRPDTARLSDLASVVVELVSRRTPQGPIALVGHSLGAAIAVETAQILADRVRAVVSLEGNLTEADTYFSGQAADHDTPLQFKRHLMEHIWRLAASDPAMQRYFGSLLFADAETLWSLGRDARQASCDDALGHAFRALTCPTLYCWSATSTPERTQRFLADFEIDNLQLHGTGHWPMIDVPDELATVLAEFVHPRLA